MKILSFLASFDSKLEIADKTQPMHPPNPLSEKEKKIKLTTVAPELVTLDCSFTHVLLHRTLILTIVDS